ncbi:hypothetical protein KIN20_008361 [Parelaphostrongylus tenuis]|uniref:Uncharacterized protein n=1 Tax=Parelaphostrongylus tenuis TaxID=148309 RepID=A0AAD5MQD9_PARTN|nr:hypothetical protein KIN20_008361 [Parelaphostrongylus tenuis]
MKKNVQMSFEKYHVGLGAGAAGSLRNRPSPRQPKILPFVRGYSMNTSRLPTLSEPQAPPITHSESKGGKRVHSKPLEIMDDPDVLKFDDGVQVHVDHVRKSIQKGAYLYGPLASFCIVHYIPKVLHSADWAKYVSLSTGVDL